MSESSKPLTRLLREWRSGNPEALNAIVPMVQDELHKLARRHLRFERTGHTLDTSALVNELYIKLVDVDVSWQDRAHFFAISARSMRRILVDYARNRSREKRGGGDETLPLDETLVTAKDRPADVVELDEALGRLARLDARKSHIVELKFFGGLNYEETAEVLGISTATVNRELRAAEAWLREELSGGH